MARDEQDEAEELDDDRIVGDYPPERPLGAEDYGTTEAEERIDEPLEEEVAREEPDQLPPRRDDPGPDPEHPGPLAEDDLVSGDPTRRDVTTEHEAPEAAEDDAVHVREP